MRKFKFKYTLRNGQTGSGIIAAPSIVVAGILARQRFNLHDVRIYGVEEVFDESENKVD